MGTQPSGLGSTSGYAPEHEDVLQLGFGRKTGRALDGKRLVVELVERDPIPV